MKVIYHTRSGLIAGVAVVLLSGFLGGFFCSGSAYAASYLTVSSGSGEDLSFGKVKPGASGASATTTDTLTINTNCSVGYSVYVSAQSGKGTSLVNTDPNITTNNTIATSSAAIGSAAVLSNNTWGLSADSTSATTGQYVGLPTYANALNTPLTIMSDVAEQTTVPIYYGLKVTTALAPGTYTGDILYTVLASPACDVYAIHFNANGGTGTMNNQIINVGVATPLTANAFTRTDYNFLGWSTSANGKTGTAVNGIGTAADVDYTDSQSITDISDFNTTLELYAIWELDIVDMQTWGWSDCANLSEGQQVSLRDARDQRVYTVKKLPDSKCWMTQNLALGMDATSTGLTLTPVNTNIDDGKTYYLSPAGKQGSSTIDDSSTLTATTTANFGASNDNRAKTQFRAKDSSIANDSDTGYYNFYTATLGFSYDSDDKTSGSSTRDICPKGWRLPKTTDNGSSVASGSPAEFTTLAKTYNPSASWTNTATSSSYYTQDTTIHTGIHNGAAANGNNYAGFSYAGNWNSTNTSASSVGSYGDYWSSSVYNTSRGYGLYFNSSNIYPQNYYYKYNGLAVRCVAKDPPPIMQETIATDLSVDVTTVLRDSRDNQEYTVYRWPTTGTAGTDYPTGMKGYAIMTQDLSLGYVTGSSVTKGANLTLTTANSVGAGTINARTDTSDWRTGYLEYINGPSVSGNTYSEHSYYNYYAASIVCPKGWRLPTKTEYSSIATFMGGDNATGSTKIRNAPYNFFLGGHFTSSGWSDQGSYGRYWTSTQDEDLINFANNLELSSAHLATNYLNNKSSGLSVRCIAEMPTMQNFDPTTKLPNVGDQIELMDTRDERVYTVKRLPDGKVWMTQNLALGMSATDTGLTLTPANTNIDDGKTYYLPPAGKQGSSTIDDSSTLTATTTANFTNNSSTDKHAKTQFRTKNTSYTNDSDTGYYNFYTATLGFSYIGDGKTSGSSTRDICPKGWRLPKITDNSSSVSSGSAAEFTALVNSYLSTPISGTGDINTANTDARTGINTGLAAAGNNYAGFSYSGYWDSANSSATNVGSSGNWWSASVYNSSFGYFLYIYSSTGGIYPQRSNYKSTGRAVRCIAKGPTMQDFNPATSLPNVGDQTTLTDTRDLRTYTVKRLPDGKVWMTQNLAIGIDGAKTLTSANTNIDNDATYYLPPAGKQGASTIDQSSTLTATTASSFSTSNDNRAKTRFRTKDSSVTNDSDTGYYNFYTATLGYSYYMTSGSGTGNAYGTSTRDICPKGWRLPKTPNSESATVSSVGSDNDFTYLAKVYNSNAVWSTWTDTGRSIYTTDSTIRTGIFNGFATAGNNYAGFSHAGWWSDSSAASVGSEGNYWTASVYNIENGYYLSFYGEDVVSGTDKEKNAIFPQRDSRKHAGLTIRCVAK